VATISRGEREERYRFISEHHRHFGVAYLCRWLGVSRSGYYQWIKPEPTDRETSDQRLLKRIGELFESSGGIYGAPRIHQALKREGIHVGRKRVARLMREYGMRGRCVRVYKTVPKGTRKYYSKHPNRLLEAGKPTGINQQWVGDVTYLKVGQQWLYLSTVMDRYSRRILAWKLSKDRTAEVTCKVLRKALKVSKAKSQGLLFHTDRGSEYGADKVQDLLKEKGMVASMNRPGKCTDNGVMESFFHSLKAEKLTGQIWKSYSGLRKAIKDYIDGFYNRSRLHSGLGYLSPLEYEAKNG
jgi:putative transposase